jgi:hypothetical protein
MGSFDRLSTGAPWVASTDPLQMWYYGIQNGPNGNLYRIGRATSTDYSTWTKDPANPVLIEGAPTDFHRYSIDSIAVLVEPGIDKAWYTGIGTGVISRIGYATNLRFVVTHRLMLPGLNR